jgi:hypothetical protein
MLSAGSEDKEMSKQKPFISVADWERQATKSPK